MPRLSPSGFLLLVLGVVGLSLFLTGNLDNVLARLFSTPASGTPASVSKGIGTATAGSAAASGMATK